MADIKTSEVDEKFAPVNIKAGRVKYVIYRS
jgi:hypothetical protein